MTVTRDVLIECDHGGRLLGCAESWIAQPNQSVTSARKEAQAAGWRRRDGQDFCPEHARPPKSS